MSIYADLYKKTINGQAMTDEQKKVVEKLIDKFEEIFIDDEEDEEEFELNE